MILTIGPGGCGFTFLNWSIAYLRGDMHYTTLNGTTSQVNITPIYNHNTAHNFKKDHVRSTADLSKLQLAHTNSIIYTVPTCQADLDYVLSIDCKKIIFNVDNAGADLMARMCTTIPNNGYMKFIMSVSDHYPEQHVKQVMIESNKFFTRYYTVPAGYLDYCTVTYQDMFKFLDCRIQNIFKYLKLNIDPDRYNNWLPIYYQYQQANQNILNEFLGSIVPVDNTEKIKIIKEIIKWKNGLFQNI